LISLHFDNLVSLVSDSDFRDLVLQSLENEAFRVVFSQHHRGDFVSSNDAIILAGKVSNNVAWGAVTTLNLKTRNQQQIMLQSGFFLFFFVFFLMFL
jgi:hypothetical protein